LQHNFDVVRSAGSSVYNYINPVRSIALALTSMNG
jgi:hypothetical protein